MDPWEDPFRSAWQKLVDDPAMREPLAEWLGRVAALIKMFDKSQVSCISEHDEAQLGEVPASLLAAAEEKYLPVYVALMKVWDLDHAVTQFDVSAQLITHYGPGPTTELAAIIKPWC